jgi:hypothetical protein
MSTLPAVTMQDLELEQAELLPSRETLCSPRGTQNGNGGGFLSGNQVQVLSGFSLIGNGTAQNGNGNVIGFIG